MGAFDTSYDELSGPLQLAPIQRKARQAIPSAPDPLPQGDSVKSPVRMPAVPGQAAGMNYADVQGGVIGQNQKPTAIPQANPMAGITGNLAAPTAPTAPTATGASPVAVPAQTATPVAQSSPANILNSIVPNVSLGKGQPPTIYGNGGLPADVVQRDIETMRGQLATPQVAQPAPAIAETGVVKPVDTNRPWYAGADSRDERTGLEMERARRGEATQAGVLNDPVKSAIQYGVVGAPAATVQQQQATEPVSIASLPAVYSPQQSYQPGSVMAKVAAGNDTYVQSKAGDPVAPVSIKPGFDKSGIITAESAQSAYANNATGNKGIMGNANVFGTTDMASANAVDQRANNVRQQMIDAQVGGGTGKPVSWQDQHGNADPEKQRIADSNALLNKWDKQYQNGQMIAEMGRNPRAAQGIAHLAAAAGHDEALSRGQDIAAGTHADEDMTKRRGQDVIAQSEAAKLAGNPQEQQLKQAQAQGIMAGLESDKMIDDIRKKAIAGDAQSLAVYQSLTGKNNPSYKAIHAEGGQTMDGKNPDQVFVIDERTGNARSLTGGQQGQQAQAPASFDAYAKAVREANAGRTLSDAELKAKYDAKYGAQK